jgi:hypothetical protein
MDWHYVHLHSDQAKSEVARFMSDLADSHRDEVAGGKISTYDLYRREAENGDQVIVIPPATAHLAG